MGRNKFKKRETTTLEERKKSKESKTVKNKENVVIKKTSSTYSVDQLLDKAEEFLDQFDYDLAQKFCQRALEVDNENVRAIELTGTVLLEMGDPESAQQCFLRAIEISPEDGHAKYMYLGQMYSGLDAVKCFQKGIELMLKQKQIEDQQPVIGAEGGKKEPSITQIDISNAYCSIAEIYMTDSCFEAVAEDKCKENIDSAILADPNNPEAYQQKASFLLSLDKKEDARIEINKSVSLWLPKAKCKEEDLPEEDFDPVQSVPISYETRIATCRILLEVEEYQTSIDVAEGLLDENDEDPQVWYLIGWANYLHGDDYKGNARYYLQKAKKVYAKTKYQDEELLKHIEELLNELPTVENDDQDVEEDDGVLIHDDDLDDVQSSDDEESMEH
ncbi:hypothetical protein SNE40_022747 [Patella caerulea]|uniref:Assembly chaperone of rpl4 n=1 Tax=Patella caerulea TaxID=87958 RepID=A0AAN8GBB6_PATCE